MDSVTSPMEAYRLLVADVYELAGVSRRTAEEIARQRGQTVARWHVLSAVAEEPCSAAAAARRLGLARQSVQRVVDQLQEEGLVTVAPNPRDRRAPLVSPTAGGRQALAALVAASEVRRAGELRASGLAAEDLLAARETLRSLICALRR